jgi:hypothetical protein
MRFDRSSLPETSDLDYHRYQAPFASFYVQNEVSMLMLKADPQGATHIYNLRKEALDEVTNTTRKDIKSLTQTYTGNTSLVAILIATITFAAAFTLPGGYNTDATPWQCAPHLL